MSDGLSVSPIPNITIPNIGVIADVLIHVNDAGKERATAVTAITTIVICAAIHAAIVSILFLIININGSSCYCM